MSKKKAEEIVGRTITEMRPMTPEELDAEGWEENAWAARIALVLDNGFVIYASQDEEGNGPGCLFGRTPKGKTVAFYGGAQ